MRLPAFPRPLGPDLKRAKPDELDLLLFHESILQNAEGRFHCFHRLLFGEAFFSDD